MVLCPSDLMMCLTSIKIHSHVVLQKGNEFVVVLNSNFVCLLSVLGTTIQISVLLHWCFESKSLWFWPRKIILFHKLVIMRYLGKISSPHRLRNSSKMAACNKITNSILHSLDPCIAILRLFFQGEFGTCSAPPIPNPNLPLLKPPKLPKFHDTNAET